MTMSGQPKPLASLSSTLLARKGQARPAMRPQGFGGFGSFTGTQDDLGWNDMGHPEGHGAEPVYAPPAAVPPVLRQREALQEEFESPQPLLKSRAIQLEGSYDAEPAHEPEEAREPEAYEPEAYESEPLAPTDPEPVFKPAPVVHALTAPVATVSPATAAGIGREAMAKRGKVAFTLRLDQDRHLRLRLASALHNCSAQVLVTQALDTFLQSLPEVEELARQLPPRATR